MSVEQPVSGSSSPVPNIQYDISLNYYTILQNGTYHPTFTNHSSDPNTAPTPVNVIVEAPLDALQDPDTGWLGLCHAELLKLHEFAEGEPREFGIHLLDITPRS